MASAVTSATARRRLPRDDRSQQLLEIAEAVFAERGIHAASMEDIAERAGVTKPVVYDHFGSKDGLVAAVVLRAGALLGRQVLAAVDAATDPPDKLAAGLRAYFGFMAQRRASWTALLTETATSTAAAAALERVRDQQADLIAALVGGGVPGCDRRRARMYAQVVIGSCERLATRPGRGRVTVDELTRHMMDVIWCGFAAIRAGDRWTG